MQDSVFVFLQRLISFDFLVHLSEYVENSCEEEVQREESSCEDDEDVEKGGKVA